jgi:hypothetical protein
LILVVFDDDALQFTVRVAYGTSQCITVLHRGEFSILRNRNPAAYAAAGLSYDTKFNLGQALDLTYSTEWFSVPPAAAPWPDAQTGRAASFPRACRPSCVQSPERTLLRLSL